MPSNGGPKDIFKGRGGKKGGGREGKKEIAGAQGQNSSFPVPEGRRRKGRKCVKMHKSYC